VDIGTVIAYKYGDCPLGQSEVRRKTMASKKSKKLQKSKRLTKVANTTVKKVYR
jgi:hypothetical protein